MIGSRRGRLERERRGGSVLRELAPRPFEPVIWKEANVHRDTHIVFDRAFPSVPWRLIGKAVVVRAVRHSVEN